MRRRVWSRTASAPSSCCEEELKVWNNFRKRLASEETNCDRINHMKDRIHGQELDWSVWWIVLGSLNQSLESRINLITEKGCCLYTMTSSAANKHKKQPTDIKTASLGETNFVQPEVPPEVTHR